MALNLDLKKLLPFPLRGGRWGELLEVIQDILFNTLKPEKIDIIKSQYNIDLMAYDDFFNICNELGYTLISIDGWCASIEYLKRQTRVVFDRIENKTLAKSYKSLFYIYNIIGGYYPYYQSDDDDLLYPLVNWETDNETIGIPQFLDTGLTLDSDEFTILDYSSNIGNLVRHILFTYQFRNVESSIDFMSKNTTTLLERDTKLQLKRTEIPYFEPRIVMNASSGVTTVESYNSFDLTESGIVQTYYFGSSGSSGIADAFYVHLGSGIASGVTDGLIPTTVTDVKTLTKEFLVSGFSWDTFNSGVVQGRVNTPQKQQLEGYKEMALLNSSSGILFYSTFPKINFSDTMYSNIYVDITLV